LEKEGHGHCRARAGQHIYETPADDPEHVRASRGGKKAETETGKKRYGQRACNVNTTRLIRLDENFTMAECFLKCMDL
jgi:hypothetical protein